MLTGLALAPSAQALRCGSKVISDGDPASRVLHYCGEPEAIETRLMRGLHYPRQRGSDGFRNPYVSGPIYEEITVEEWTYNFGPYKLMRVLRFENGRLRNIERLGYGYRRHY